MTTSVSSASQQVYVSPAVAGVAAAGVQAETATASQVAAPFAQTLAGGPLLASNTVGALVEQQAAPAEAPAKPAADTESAEANEPFASYQVYMPTREGFSSFALAVAVESPDAVSSSAGKTDEEIATDARARLDANYAKMEETGAAFSYNSFEGVDWHTLFGDLDPKSLAAVKENRGGLFTEQEQTLGNYFLQIQENFRQGAYSGPTRLMGQYLASGRSNMSPEAAAGAMKLWDEDAAKNKTDVGSQLGRASMRVLLGDAAGGMFGDGMAPADRMMSLLVDALRTAREKDPDVLDKIGNVRTRDDLQDQEWFQGHMEELDAILKSFDAEAKAEDQPELKPEPGA